MVFNLETVNLLSTTISGLDLNHLFLIRICIPILDLYPDGRKIRILALYEIYDIFDND
jgi:hypothetical protein